MENNNNNLVGILLDSNHMHIHIHNYNTHSTIKYRPVNLLNTIDQEINNEVINNIKKYTKQREEISILKIATK